MFGENQKCANISSSYGFIFFSANTSNHRPVKFLSRAKMRGTIRGASSTSRIWSDTIQEFTKLRQKSAEFSLLR